MSLLWLYFNQRTLLNGKTKFRGDYISKKFPFQDAFFVPSFFDIDALIYQHMNVSYFPEQALTRLGHAHF
ncbi:hypothetical protein BIY29_19055 [Brenneria alni]|uniref:Uncharacterized protein n=1 Tax=Brenneria alni TaxID=71656 RepID=A0A421DIV0_9GAMM|nr:hypothetical protein BIY29_19055 [Brenneria alni]